MMENDFIESFIVKKYPDTLKIKIFEKNLSQFYFTRKKILFN